jgi:hypothetical protein
MPVYSFRNKNTGEEFTDIMSNSDREAFLSENPEIEQVLSALNIVGGVGGIKTDGGFQDNLQRIAAAHPNSNLAASMGSKLGVKEAKTRQALEKWKKKRKAAGDSI